MNVVRFFNLPQKDSERVLDNAGKAMKRIIAVWHALIEETLKLSKTQKYFVK